MIFDGTNMQMQSQLGSPDFAFASIGAGSTGGMTATTQNATLVYGFWIPGHGVTVSGICYYVNTPDNTANLYDVGVYDSNGNLAVHTGAIAGSTSFAAVGFKCTATTATVYLSPGAYVIAMTSSAASPIAKWGGVTTTPQFANAVTATGGTTSGGVLNNSITFATVTWASGSSPNFGLHN